MKINNGSLLPPIIENYKSLNENCTSNSSKDKFIKMIEIYSNTLPKNIHASRHCINAQANVKAILNRIIQQRKVSQIEDIKPPTPLTIVPSYNPKQINNSYTSMALYNIVKKPIPKSQPNKSIEISKNHSRNFARYYIFKGKPHFHEYEKKTDTLLKTMDKLKDISSHSLDKKFKVLFRKIKKINKKANELKIKLNNVNDRNLNLSQEYSQAQFSNFS